MTTVDKITSIILTRKEKTYHWTLMNIFNRRVHITKANDHIHLASKEIRLSQRHITKKIMLFIMCSKVLYLWF